MASITFYGGVGTVTGSKCLLENNGRRVLVDRGLFQGLKHHRERNWQDPRFAPSSIDAVIITHAHIDHTGWLPRLVKLGFEGPVFTSRATADLLKILLPDSGRLQEEDADYRNRHQLSSHTPALPLYDEQDARAALDLLQTFPNDGELHDICEGFRAGFSVAGHIMGASQVLVEMDGVRTLLSASGRQDADSQAAKETSPEEPAMRTGVSALRFLFSGDLGHYDQPILND